MVVEVNPAPVNGAYDRGVHGVSAVDSGHWFSKVQASDTIVFLLIKSPLGFEKIALDRIGSWGWSIGERPVVIVNAVSMFDRTDRGKLYEAVTLLQAAAALIGGKE
jgi:hypothetical protein